MKEVNGERVFVCVEGLCEFYLNNGSVTKGHKANLRDIDATYYFSGQKGCDFKAKEAGNTKHSFIILMSFATFVLRRDVITRRSRGLI